MPRKFQPHWLEQELLYSGIAIPVDEATAAPVIELLGMRLEPENISQDGEASPEEMREGIERVMRAKADLEIILGRKITLDNQE
jgi:hypothetical protein